MTVHNFVYFTFDFFSKINFNDTYSPVYGILDLSKDKCYQIFFIAVFFILIKLPQDIRHFFKIKESINIPIVNRIFQLHNTLYFGYTLYAHVSNLINKCTIEVDRRARRCNLNYTSSSCSSAFWGLLQIHVHAFSRLDGEA